MITHKDLNHILNILEISANTIDSIIRYVEYSSNPKQRQLLAQLSYVKGLQMGLSSAVKEMKNRREDDEQV